MVNLVAAPVLVPLITAVVLVPLTGRTQRALSLAGGVLNLAVAAALLGTAAAGRVVVLDVGGWGPELGIVWVVDRLGAAMLGAAAVLGLAVLACLPAGWLRERPHRFVDPLVHLLLVGVNGSLVTGDFFNLFVFFEVMLLASFALVVSGEGEGMLERTFPYVLVNLVASFLFLAGLGTLYGALGTVNMAEVAERLPAAAAPTRVAAGLLLAVFAVKAALVPVFVWLPDSYPAPPLTLTALFAGTLTEVGVYILFRSTPLLFAPGDPVYPALVALGAATMAVGVLGALGRATVRGILAFHIVSQVGYMVFGLGLGTPAALGAALLFTVHNMVVKPALVLAGGVAERLHGTGDLKALGGLASRPWAAAAFFVPAMALAGIPPLSGFWGKFLLVSAGFAREAFAATAVALAVGLLTLASMLKIWSAAYWHGREEPPPRLGGHERRLVASALALAAVAVALGLAIAPLVAYAEAAAAEALSTRSYRAAVLGESR